MAQTPASYHHGDLRAALIQATREFLRTHAPETVSMKSLAESLGVSQPAPYRHFEGRAALLAAVAEDGFERFGAALSAAVQDGPAEAAFERACLAYIEFGLGNVGVYHLMFSRATLDAAPAQSLLSRSADASFQLLVDLVSRHAGPDDATKAAVSAWSTLHGAVMLKAEGLLSQSMSATVSMADIVDGLVSRLGPARPKAARTPP